ncbi:MAG: PspC domain-containing protein [Candidatus Hydrogenedentota bacterium]
MKLTPNQERRITKFLRDVHAQTEGLSDAQRRRALAHVKAQLRERLQHYTDAAPEDSELEAILDNCTLPDFVSSAADQHARDVENVEALDPSASPRETPPPRREPRAARGEFLELEGRMWLGVCSGLARYLRIESAIVRIIAAVVGVATLGFLLWVYVGLYLFFYLRDRSGVLPRVDVLPVVRRVAGTLALGVVLFAAGELLLWAMSAAAALAVGHGVTLEAAWGWFAERNGTIAFWTLVFALPLGGMSAMPVAEGWDHTLRKLAQACLAIYGLLLSFGLACYFVGLLLETTGAATGVISRGIE